MQVVEGLMRQLLLSAVYSSFQRETCVLHCCVLCVHRAPGLSTVVVLGACKVLPPSGSL